MNFLGILANLTSLREKFRIDYNLFVDGSAYMDHKDLESMFIYADKYEAALNGYCAEFGVAPVPFVETM